MCPLELRLQAPNNVSPSSTVFKFNSAFVRSGMNVHKARSNTDSPTKGLTDGVGFAETTSLCGKCVDSGCKENSPLIPVKDYESLRNDLGSR
jgi:hypothetical protein